MPLIRLVVRMRRYPRVWRLALGIVVMIVLFAMLLSAVEPLSGRI